MQFYFYEIDYCINYKFEIIVMLLTYVKQHSKNLLPLKMCYWKLYKILSNREDAKVFDLIKILL